MESLPKEKRKPFKPHIEKQKKFDELVDEFPNKKLATPVEVDHLKKIARQQHSNKLRREKRKQEGGNAGGGGAVAKLVPKEIETELAIPQKGVDFSTVEFREEDFE